MKIAFFGNICNNLYQIAKALRAHSGFETHLYLENINDPQQLPESDDPQLRNNYPDWIHKGSYLTPAQLVAPWRSSLVKQFSSHDLIVVSSLGPIFAQFAKKPTAFLCSGGDVTIQPFPLEFRFRYTTAREIITAFIIGFWQRRGIRTSSRIWSQPFFPFINALEKLGIPQSNVSESYFPVLVDTQKFKVIENTGDNLDPIVKYLVNNFDFILFHPSRIMINPSSLLKATGQWKQNDLLFRGFARFLQNHPHNRAVLIMPERSESPDIPLAKQIIRDLEIEKNVVWLKPPRPFGYTRDELIPLYSICDAVADEFGIGWFGSVVLEGLAMEKPVLSYVDKQVMSKLYPWHPILSDNSVEGVAELLSRLYANVDYRRDKGLMGRKWVEEFHSETNAAQIYVKNMLQLVNSLKL